MAQCTWPLQGKAQACERAFKPKPPSGGLKIRVMFFLS